MQTMALNVMDKRSFCPRCGAERCVTSALPPAPLLAFIENDDFARTLDSNLAKRRIARLAKAPFARAGHVTRRAQQMARDPIAKAFGA